MGRAAMFLQGPRSANDAELMQRVKFADALMFTTRGNPVTYYGDEQGFIGTGGDQLAREDMFASKVDIYNGEKVLGGPSGSMDRYNDRRPLYTWIKDLSAARAGTRRWPTAPRSTGMPRTGSALRRLPLRP